MELAKESTEIVYRVSWNENIRVLLFEGRFIILSVVGRRVNIIYSFLLLFWNNTSLPNPNIVMRQWKQQQNLATSIATVTSY